MRRLRNDGKGGFPLTQDSLGLRTIKAKLWRKQPLYLLLLFRETLGYTPHCLREIARHALSRVLRITAKKDKHDERSVRMLKKVHQKVLMHPVDLAQHTPHPVAFDGAPAAPRRKSDLEWHVISCGLARDDPKEQSHATDGDRVHVRPAAIKERADQPLPLEAVRTWKRVSALTFRCAWIRHRSRFTGAYPCARRLH